MLFRLSELFFTNPLGDNSNRKLIDSEEKSPADKVNVSLQRLYHDFYSTEGDDSLMDKEEMKLKKGIVKRRWKSAKTILIAACLKNYKKCLIKLRRYLNLETKIDNERRKSQARLQPLPDRPIRRVASKLNRKPTNELERLRKKGEDWNANDLFRFQYSDPESGSPEERRELCYEWLDRLHEINKKYCYLAWYESAIYACYYRLAPILYDPEEKAKIWEDVKQEYAEIFLMGRRIWRRPIHPSRLRVFYDMAMLCTRFSSFTSSCQNDSTILLFRDLLADATNFDFKVLDEVEFAKSIDKVNQRQFYKIEMKFQITRLENYVIDQFYSRRRRSSGSIRNSFKSRSRADYSPSRKSFCEEKDDSDDAAGPSTSTANPRKQSLPNEIIEVGKSMENLSLARQHSLVTITLCSIFKIRFKNASQN
ncbi:hypothetical protein WR25_09851 isoform B [Diploscapter pachys]|uniref:DUF7758 domain-containing protein n=1 Tax=Diploscapter pachys TaxID=2018661 RepID=A0A2A2JIP6_9BILA|nr:hypothetical protein WR25_09851 isoform B [Diploscapter pachys]